MTDIVLHGTLPILSAGKQTPGSGKVCAEQAVNWLVSGRLELGDETDHPSCVQPVLNVLAIAVNDNLDDTQRYRMWPSILRQPGTVRPDLEPVLSVRLAAWCAGQVVHLAGNYQEVAQKALQAALAWCDNPCEETRASAYVAYRDAADQGAVAYSFVSSHESVAASVFFAVSSARYTASAAATATADFLTDATLAASHAVISLEADVPTGPSAPLRLLSGCQAEHERLTGHVPPQPDMDRIERLKTLVGKV